VDCGEACKHLTGILRDLGREEVNAGWTGLPLTHASHSCRELMDQFMWLSWQERETEDGTG